MMSFFEVFSAYYNNNSSISPSKNNSTESHILLEPIQIPPAINRIFLHSQNTALCKINEVTNMLYLSYRGRLFCLRQIPIYSNAITAPSYFSSMNFLISSDLRTFTKALIASLSSLPSFTAMMFTYVYAASESDASYASASFFTEYPA